MASAPNTRGTQGQGRDPSLREGRPATPGSAPPAHGPVVPGAARPLPASSFPDTHAVPQSLPRPCWADTGGSTVGRHRGQREAQALT